MQLIEFETRLEKTEKWERNPYKFKTYARVSLNVQDAKDIELVKTTLSDEFLESINWEENTAFFELFYLKNYEHRFRKEDKILAFTRLAIQFKRFQMRVETSVKKIDYLMSTIPRYILLIENCVHSGSILRPVMS